MFVLCWLALVALCGGGGGGYWADGEEEPTATARTPPFFARWDWYVSLDSKSATNRALRSHCHATFCYVLRPASEDLRGDTSTHRSAAVVLSVYRNSLEPFGHGPLFGTIHSVLVRESGGRDLWTHYLPTSKKKTRRFPSLDAALADYMGAGFADHVLEMWTYAERLRIAADWDALLPAHATCDDCLRQRGFGLAGTQWQCKCCALGCQGAILPCRRVGPCEVMKPPPPLRTAGWQDKPPPCYDPELAFNEFTANRSWATNELRGVPVCLPEPSAWAAQHRARIHSLSRALDEGHTVKPPPLAMVIAHCSEPLNWLVDGGLQDIPLTVYEKCQAGRPECPTPDRPLEYTVHRRATNESTGAWGMRAPVRVTTGLCNTGEECQGYLRFIVDHYDALPDFTLFLQGAPMRHSPYLDQVVPRLRVDRLDFVSLANLYIGYNVTAEPSSPMHLPGRRPLLASYIPRWFGSASPNLMGCFCCGMFAASRRAIRARPLLFWRTLLAVADGNVPAYKEGDGRRRLEAGLFERIWHIAFGEDPMQRHYLKRAYNWNHWGLHGYRNHLSDKELSDYESITQA